MRFHTRSRGGLFAVHSPADDVRVEVRSDARPGGRRLDLRRRRGDVA